MANRRAMKLFAVAMLAGAGVAEASPIKPRTLANARPACGNTGGKSSQPADCTPAEIRAATEALRKEQKAAEQRAAEQRVAAEKQRAAAEKLRAALAAVVGDRALTVRTLENGRPACGNTMSKSPRRVACREDAQ